MGWIPNAATGGAIPRGVNPDLPASTGGRTFLTRLDDDVHVEGGRRARGRATTWTTGSWAKALSAATSTLSCIRLHVDWARRSRGPRTALSWSTDHDLDERRRRRRSPCGRHRRGPSGSSSSPSTWTLKGLDVIVEPVRVIEEGRARGRRWERTWSGSGEDVNVVGMSALVEERPRPR